MGKPKSGQHYQRLAQLAQANDFHRVTPWVIQSWVKHGLIPRIGFNRPRFGVREPTGVPEIERQLLALCTLRYARRIRSHVELALILWSDGWEIEEPLVRSSFRQYLVPVSKLADAELRADFVDKAVRNRHLPPRWLRGKNVETALALDTMFALLSGAKSLEPDDLSETAHMERVTHLDRARTDAVEGAAPWLPTAPGVGFAQGAVGVSVPRLLRALELSSAKELEDARRGARQLSRKFDVIFPTLELAAGRNFAGFGPFADAAGDPRFVLILVLLTLVLPTEANEFVGALPPDEVLQGWEAAVDGAKRMLEENSELAARSASVGMTAALEERACEAGARAS